MKSIIQLLKFDDLKNIYRESVFLVFSQVPDYYEIIKTPIDLQMVKSKLLSDDYPTAQEMMDDMGLLFNNAFEYNTVRENRLCGIVMLIVMAQEMVDVNTIIDIVYCDY